MRIHVQRVTSASVAVDGKVVGTIERGLLLLVGFGADDTETALPSMAAKVANLRVFPNDKSHFHYSVTDINGAVLSIPQFTLYGDCRKGRRPDFSKALSPEDATRLFDLFNAELGRELGTPPQTGIFGADMKVSLLNDGPVTLLLEG